MKQHRTNLLVDMLNYKRPSGSKTEQEFCDRYLKPVFGLPDKHGNYVLTVGDKPRVSFMAHYDTVHKKGGYQRVTCDVDNFVRATDSDCLGADDTTGIWLILGMIKSGVEGTYVIHSAEESGCLGSRDLVASKPKWLDHTDAAISFDRRGTDSIVTHQLGSRTCSDDFANSLGTVLDLPMYPDPDGVYTDSNEYAAIVPECTNISVGYYNQHTSLERQDLVFAQTLLERLCKARWSDLLISRDPYLPDDEESYSQSNFYNYGYGYDYDEFDAMQALVESRSAEVTNLLLNLGITVDALCEEMGIDYDNKYYSNYTGYRR